MELSECIGLGCGGGSWFQIFLIVGASGIILGLLMWVIYKRQEEEKKNG